MMTSPFYPTSLLGRLERHADEYRDRTVYTFLRDRGDTETLTFGQLARRVRSIAAQLRDQFKPGDRAVLLYPQGLEFICSYLGCLAAGLVAVPAYPPRRNRKADRLNGVIADCAPSALLTVGAGRDTFPVDLADTPVLVTDEWPTTDSPPWDRAAIQPGTVAFLQYTSGSTGTPKGVIVTHGNIACNEQQLAKSFLNNPETVKVSWLPLFHDMGLIDGALQGLYVGCHSVLLAPASFAQNPIRWLQAVTAYRATATGGPNFAFDLCARMVTEEQKSGIDLSSLRVLYNGAEPVSGGTLDRFATAFAQCGFKSEMLLPCYGLAEATLFVTGVPPDAEPKRVWVHDAALEAGQIEAARPDAIGAKCLISCGVPAAGVEIRVVALETRTPVPTDQVGEIWIKSGCVAAGYWARTDDTQATFENRLADGEGPFLATGDLGFMKEGELYVTGRVKDLIIVRGRNIYPQDVEAAVAAEADIIEPNGCAAFAIEGPGGEEVIGIVAEVDRSGVRAAKSDPAQTEAVAARIRAVVADEFEVVVGRVMFVRPGSFPRTSSGKVQRLACRRALHEQSLDAVFNWSAAAPARRSASGGPASLREELHRIVVRYLQTERNLSIERIDPNESLLALGLDSLGAAAVAAVVTEETGRHLSPELVYDFPTIAKLARYLEGRHTGARPTASANSAANGRDGRSCRAINDQPVPQANHRSLTPGQSFDHEISERIERMNGLKAAGRYFYETPFTCHSDTESEIDGRRVMMLASFGYLGLIGHPEVNEAAKAAIDRYGAGCHGVRLLAGTTALHRELERELAAFVGAEDAIAYSSGYATNLATIQSLVGPGDAVVGDELNHASIVDGCVISGAEFHKFKHNDTAHLESILRSITGRKILVVVDGVYSMEGDIAPLPEITRLCRQYHARLMVDEAHSLGVVGRTGRGVQEHFGLSSDAIDIKMGNLSKALGSQGGFVAGRTDLIEFLRHHARGYVFSTALGPPLAAAALKALEILRREPWRPERLQHNARRLAGGLRAVGLRTTDTDSAIIPLLCRTEEEALRMTTHCRDHGVFVVPVIYPAVPMDAPRLRLNVMATHTDADIDFALGVIRDAKEKSHAV